MIMKTMLLLALAIFMSSASWGTEVYLRKAIGVDVSESQIQLVNETARLSISDQLDAKFASNEEQAECALQPKLINLGGIYLLTIEKIKSGSLLKISKVKIQNMDELDKSMGRLIRASLSNERVDEDIRLGEITRVEAEEKVHQTSSLRSFYVGFGPYASTNLKSDGLLVGLDLAYNWEFRHNVLLKVFLDGAISPSSEDLDRNGNLPTVTNGERTGGSRNSAGMSILGIGAAYHFNDRDNSPFIGAEMGYGIAQKVVDSVETRAGATLGLNAGYRFLRNASVNLDIRLRYTILTAANSLGLPSTMGIQGGLYF